MGKLESMPIGLMLTQGLAHVQISQMKLGETFTGQTECYLGE